MGARGRGGGVRRGATCAPPGRLARGGQVGQIATEPGRYVASVEDGAGSGRSSGTPAGARRRRPVARWSRRSRPRPGRVAALLAGDLPHDLVEQAEEAGVELLPYGGELGSTCSCDAWADPCVHALAVLYQLAWLVEADPFVLFQLRGLPRDELLARLHARTVADRGRDVDLDRAVEAALYAARIARSTDGPPQRDLR